MRIAEYSQCFNQSRENCNEPDSILGSPKLEVSFYDDFESSYLARPDLNNDMPLPSVEQGVDFLTSLSQDLAPHTSLPMDVTKDALVSADSPAPSHYSREFEEGEDLESASELNMSAHMKLSLVISMSQKNLFYRGNVRRHLNPLDWTLVMIFFL